MKKLAVIALLISLPNPANADDSSLPKQTPWTVLNVRGHSIDPHTGMVDDTEGFGAFDSIMKLFNPSCPTNFDNGGGSFDDTTNYVKDSYDIENIVYDPFMRTQEHNNSILARAATKKFDCCTSISVLNVVDTQEARLEHIRLCWDVLKDGGSAFFKVWPGDRSGIEHKEPGRYQSNKDATQYLAEIVHGFGKDNVTLVDDKTIKAIKQELHSPDYLEFEEICQLSDDELAKYTNTIESFLQKVVSFKDSLLPEFPEIKQYMATITAIKEYLQAIQDIPKQRELYNEQYTHRPLQQKMYDLLQVPSFPFTLIHELGHAVVGKLLNNNPINIHLGASPKEVPYEKYKLGTTNFSIHSYNFSTGFSVGTSGRAEVLHSAAGSLAAIPFCYFIMKKAVDQLENSHNNKVRIVSLIAYLYSAKDLLRNIQNLTPFIHHKLADGQVIWELLGLPEPYLEKARLNAHVATYAINAIAAAYAYSKYFSK